VSPDNPLPPSRLEGFKIGGSGQTETVKYQLLDSMLLNELQKENTTIAVQKEQIWTQDQQIRWKRGWQESKRL
jgi:hypothetical protein